MNEYMIFRFYIVHTGDTVTPPWTGGKKPLFQGTIILSGHEPFTFHRMENGEYDDTHLLRRTTKTILRGNPNPWSFQSYPKRTVVTIRIINQQP